MESHSAVRMGTKPHVPASEEVRFQSAKRTILHKLQQYIDYSPKGSIDAPIVSLVHYINALPDYVTCSSCSGRIAIYCHSGDAPVANDDRKVELDDVEDEYVSGHAHSTKGAGKWLYVVHGQATAEGFSTAVSQMWHGSSAILKVEPFILHVQCAGLSAARRLLQVAIRAGFRESGIVIGTEGKTKMLVHIRSTAGGLEVPLRHQGVQLADEVYMSRLLTVSNERFADIESRRSRFESELRKEFGSVAVPSKGLQGSKLSVLPASAAKKTTQQPLKPDNIGRPITCSTCGESFPSKNAMYKQHLVEDGSDSSGGARRVCPAAGPGAAVAVSSSTAAAVPRAVPATGPVPAPAVPTTTTTAVTTACQSTQSFDKSRCEGCSASFPSRNQLFKHVQSCPLAVENRRLRLVTGSAGSGADGAAGTANSITGSTAAVPQPAALPLDAVPGILPPGGYSLERDGSGVTRVIHSCRVQPTASDIAAATVARAAAWVFLARRKRDLDAEAAAVRAEQHIGAVSLHTALGPEPTTAPDGTAPAATGAKGVMAHTSEAAAVHGHAASGDLDMLLRRYGHVSVFIPPSASPANSGGAADGGARATGHGTRAGAGNGANAIGSQGFALVFGGVCAAHGHARSGDVLLHDVSRNTWLAEGRGLTVHADPAAGLPPVRTRACGSAIRVPSGQTADRGAEYGFLLYGGHNGPATPLDDCWLLTIRVATGSSNTPDGSTPVECRWHKLSHSPTGVAAAADGHNGQQVPAPRWSATLTSELGAANLAMGSNGVPTSRALLFGGRNLADAVDDCCVATVVCEGGQGPHGFAVRWQQQAGAPSPATTAAPTARFAHAACPIVVSGRACAFVQGGYAHPVVKPGATGAGRDDALPDAWLWAWQASEKQGSSAAGRWICVEVTGTASHESPASLFDSLARWSHAAVCMGHGLVALLGGHPANPQLSASLLARLQLTGNGVNDVLTASAAVSRVPSAISNESYGRILHGRAATARTAAVVGHKVAASTEGADSARYVYPLPNLYRMHPAAWTAANHLGLFTRHTVVVIPSSGDNSSGQRLLIVGGGAVCFAFGSHFSSPCEVDVTTFCSHAPPADLASASGRAQLLSGQVGGLAGPAITAQANALAVPARHANRAREACQALGFFDWARKVGKVDGAVASAGPRADSTNQPATGKAQPLLGIPLLLVGVQQLFSALTAGTADGQGGASAGSEQSWLGSLVSSGQATLCQASLPLHGATTTSSAVEGSSGSASGNAPVASSAQPAPVQPRSAPAGHDSGKGGAQTLARLRIALRQWLQAKGAEPAIIDALTSASNSACDLPKRIEWVGDIAVLPRDAMVDPRWLAVCGGATTGAGSTGASSAATPESSSAWSVVCTVLGTRRLARHAEIDVGPTRASRVVMLHSPRPASDAYQLPALPGAPQQENEATGSAVSKPIDRPTGPVPWDESALADTRACMARLDDTSGPWVTVRQGHVKASAGDDGSKLQATATKPNSSTVTLRYSFDITRMMFSSGNVTEKSRMGHPPGRAHGRGETIADMYCGMGYFTLPLLAVAGAAHVHAADWNADALACLRLNLAANGIEPGRVTLWPGDNAQLAGQGSGPMAGQTGQPGRGVVGQCDRVLLGLIPSSERGWPTAVRLLRPDRGGMLHLHQNVHDSILSTWAHDTLPRTLLKLAREAGIPWAGRGSGSGAATAASSSRSQDRPSSTTAVDGAAATYEDILSFIRVLHVETVKSYAPQVWHVVVDVECGPAGGV